MSKYYSVSDELDRTFGPEGSESRRVAEDLAWEEYKDVAFSELMANHQQTVKAPVSATI